MEQIQPDPLVDMTSDDLSNDLCKKLRLYADSLGTLILPTSSKPNLILTKLGELEETADDNDLLGGAWFSTHARVDGAIAMVTTPEIRLVSPQCFRFGSDKIMANRHALSCDRIF